MEGTGDLVDWLNVLADADSERLLYVELLDGVHESGRLTASQLRDRSASVAGALAANGVRRGDVALLIATSPLDFLVGLFGCLWGGVIAAPIAFPRRPEHLESRLRPVRENAGAVAVVAGEPQGDAERHVLELLTQGDLPVVATAVDATPLPAPVDHREIAYLQYTSGSTSVPKGVIVTHDNLVANVGECSWLLGWTEDMVTVSWCPLTHDMGLIMGALPSIAFGCTTVLMPPGAFIRRPLAWLRAVERYRGTHTYSPNFGYDLCVERSTPEERAELDLSSMRVWFNGAEPVRARTTDRFLAAFAGSGVRPETYTPGYGLAEATVLVSATRPDNRGGEVWVDAAALEHDDIALGNATDVGVRSLCCDGVPGPGYEVRIVDPNTHEASPPDRVGEVWVWGPSVSPGYWRQPGATRATFGEAIAGEGGRRYLRTGDLGFLHEGEIVICGRAKDLIVIHGRNIHPQDVEVAVEDCHGAVRSGGSAAFAVEDEGGEALVVVAEVDGEPDVADVIGAIRGAVLQDFELRVADVLLVGPQRVPKTSSGKKQRAASRELWRSNVAV